MSWQTIGAFLPVATHPRVFARPLSSAVAWSAMENWLSAPHRRIPETSERTAQILGQLIADLDPRGNLIPDAQLAAWRWSTASPWCPPTRLRAVPRGPLDQPAERLIQIRDWNHSMVVPCPPFRYHATTFVACQGTIQRTSMSGSMDNTLFS
jgi:hypothetical protein